VCNCNGLIASGRVQRNETKVAGGDVLVNKQVGPRQRGFSVRPQFMLKFARPYCVWVISDFRISDCPYASEERAVTEC